MIPKLSGGDGKRPATTGPHCYNQSGLKVRKMMIEACVQDNTELEVLSCRKGIAHGGL